MKETYFYRLEGNYIEKYLITYNVEELLKIKEESIYKCGKKTRKSYDGVRFFKNHMYYKNLVTTEIGIQEYKDGPDETIYNYSYTEFSLTYLASIIDKIILGNIKAIDELFTLDTSKEFNGYEKEKNECLENIVSIDNNDCDNKIKALKELKKIIESEELNKDREPIVDYYKKACECFKIKFINKVTLKEYNDIMKFINCSEFKNKDTNDLVLKMKKVNK